MTEAFRKEAALTGASGFIGRNLAKRLLSDGWKVNVIARPRSDLKPLSGYAGDLSVHIHDGTMESMLGLFGNMAPSIVFHLASFFIADHASRDIPRLVNSNILFGLQLVEAMTAHNITHLVNTGTAWQHYENEGYNPVNLYASLKQAFGDLLRYYTETRGLKVITLKLFETYGPDDPRPKLLSLLMKADASGKEFEMSPGRQLIDMVFIEDVVEAFIVAAAKLEEESRESYKDYAVSSGNPISLRDLVSVYQRITGRPISIKWGGRPYRRREVMVPWSTGGRFEGWAPRVSLEKGIRRSLPETVSKS